MVPCGSALLRSTPQCIIQDVVFSISQNYNILWSSQQDFEYSDRLLVNKKEPPEEEPFEFTVGRESEAQYCAFHLAFPWSFHPAAWVWVEFGEQPGDGKYFGGFTMMEKA